MWLFNWLLGSGIKDTVQAVGSAINTHKELDQAPAMEQDKINEIEAANPNFFVSGWRPFIGWELGFCLGLYLFPLVGIATIVWVKGYINSGILGPYPIDMEPIFKLIGYMLGLNFSLRTVEKVFGVAR